MNRSERVAKLWAESDLLVRDVRLLEAELAAVLREPVVATPGGAP